MVMKPRSKENETQEAQGSALPVPFTEEEFQRDILTAFVQQLRVISWMTDAKIAWQIVGKTPPHPYDLHDPDLTVDDLDITFGDIRETSFAQCLMDMYQYAYFGILDQSTEQMTNESTHTWMAAVLCDLSRSLFAAEWVTYGGQGGESVLNCLTVAELANARRVLEGHENFSYFYGSSSKDDDSVAFGALTIRQMALLAGMEEMSIRAAANPKRANPLPTFSEEGRTRIAIDAAKAWLQSKGRYIPITYRHGRGDIDLKKRKFTSIDDLQSALDARVAFIGLREDREAAVTAKLKALGVDSMFGLGRDRLLDKDFVAALAEVLDFPTELLALRAREAVANEELASVERELRAIAG